MRWIITAVLLAAWYASAFVVCYHILPPSTYRAWAIVIAWIGPFVPASAVVCRLILSDSPKSRPSQPLSAKAMPEAPTNPKLLDRA